MRTIAKRTIHDGAHASARHDAPRAAVRPWSMAALAILLSAAACGAPQGEDEASSAGGPGPAGNTPLGLTPATTAAGKYRVWPDGRIPYRIDDSVEEPTRTRLIAAMKEWQTKSEQRVRFEKKDAGDTAFLDVVGSLGALTSRVGYKAGTKVEMQLRNPEYITVIRHELGHVLGLHHEHRREGREAHIQVRSSNVVDSDHCEYQFSVCDDCVLLGEYNKKSVMHYRTSDLKKCRTGPVLLEKNDSFIDHVWVIGSGDLQAVEELYGAAPEAADGAGGAGASAGGADQGGGDAVGGQEGDDSLDVGDEPGSWDTDAGGAGDASDAAAPGGAASGGCSHRGMPGGGATSALLVAVALAAQLVARQRRAAGGRAAMVRGSGCSTDRPRSSPASR